MRYQREIQAFLRGMLGAYELAQDLTQDTFSDAWALAQPESGGRMVSVIFHFHAGVWKEQSFFEDVLVTSLSFGAPDDGWALGTETSMPSQNITVTKTVFLHYHAGNWITLPTADAPQILQTQQIEMVTPTDGWALGYGVVVGGNLKAVLFHYDGKQWQSIVQPQITGRASLSFSTLSVISADDVWIGGQATWPTGTHYPTSPFVGGGSSNPPQYPVTPLLLRYHNGAWQTLLS